jgi:hypothetical protein
VAKSERTYAIDPMSPDDAADLAKIIDEASCNFRGNLAELESAIGMLYLGGLFGWKVLVLIHNKRTIRKYEEILGINIREYFPEEGPLAEKSLGYTAAKKLGGFWKAVSGEVKIEGRREIE